MPFDVNSFSDTLYSLLTTDPERAAAPAPAPDDAADFHSSQSTLQPFNNFSTIESDYADKARQWQYTKDRVGLPRASRTRPPPRRSVSTLDLSASQRSAAASTGDGQVHRMFESLQRVHSAGAVSVLPPRRPVTSGAAVRVCADPRMAAEVRASAAALDALRKRDRQIGLHASALVQDTEDRFGIAVGADNRHTRLHERVAEKLAGRAPADVAAKLGRPGDRFGRE